MTTWAFRTMIVPSDYQQFSSTLASTLGGLAGEDMFVVDLSATGLDPATNYVSTGYIGAEFAALLPLDTYTTKIDPVTGQPVVVHTHKDGNPEMIVELAADAGLEVTLQEVEDALNAMDCTEQPPFDAFARLGLSLVQTAIPPQSPV